MLSVLAHPLWWQLELSPASPTFLQCTFLNRLGTLFRISSSRTSHLVRCYLLDSICVDLLHVREHTRVLQLAGNLIGLVKPAKSHESNGGCMEVDRAGSTVQDLVGPPVRL